MAISFDATPNTVEAKAFYNKIAIEQMRPLSRKYDDLEGEVPTEWVDWWWETGRKGAPGRIGREGDGFIQVCVNAEELCFGDAALYLRMPTPALGGSAVSAAGTEEQKVRFLSNFSAEGGHPIWGAMAITEAQAGSDASAIETTADFDPETEEWILNGQKIFCTAGKGSSTVDGGFTVVWATIDRDAGRGGIKSFVVPANTPGMTLVGCEKKLGIRASDTATLHFENCRVPRDHLLGSEEVKRKDPKKTGDKGFKGVLATFDASRPIVAAMAVGVGRAALEFVIEELTSRGVVIRYDAPPAELTALERDVMEMEAELQAARLMTWRAASLISSGQPNNLEASMAKAKAGLAVTRITQKAVGLLGPAGFSKKLLVEKWMRDAKINDIYEGTQQINQLIVARRILNYPSSMLR
ncbi:MAG: acyl-CoA dehydrogenase family protein [Deltaproteobacteria bacterium]|nr:acyl-CoA dehydrogenase family protein [Deltaproteobacteria bacterium]MBW2387371.1 acyl-CoA dehydrogenase family protein [Deltaproteobacteria bacterium]